MRFWFFLLMLVWVLGGMGASLEAEIDPAYLAEHLNKYRNEDCLKCHVLHEDDEFQYMKIEAIEKGEIDCLECHSGGRETRAPDVLREFEQAASRHPAENTRDCLICHALGKEHYDDHLDEWPTLGLKDPDPEDSHVYTGAKINDFCLSCHDNSPVTLGEPPQTPIDLSSAYEFTGHGRIDINEPCTACHEHHASLTKPFLIKDAINAKTVTGNDNSVCFACHTDSSGSYLGQDTYLASEHGIQGQLCIDCHNPHGDNKDLCYLCHNEKYSAHYSTKRDKLCIDCHNPHQKADLKMTKEDEEKLCYQCHRELEREFGNLRDGISGSTTHHKVDDEEYGGGDVECFDCHNPHGVTRMNIVSDPTSRTSHLPPNPFPKDSYSFRTDAYDGFCLACHDGSRVAAKNIEFELDSESNTESGFTSNGETNLHKLHKEKMVGCQNCHDAHASSGTSGLKRGALLREEITVTSWNPTEHYYEGKSSCSASGCHS